MCAIAGIMDLLCTEETRKAMLATMTRRGPDAADWYQKENAVLLHARLAVIDLAGGAQPMYFTQNGENYCIVYNGELYNTQQIRKELQRLGHHFAGHSDTEVVLKAFLCWGEACVERFNGIFAFAVWCEREQRLFLARDRIGVKPLFYAQRNGGLLFASEIKTLLCHPELPARLDMEGAAQILLLGPGRLPGSGVFRDIREVEPGCCGWYSGGELRLKRYWKLRDREHRDTFGETVESVRWLVTDAIRRQMVSDVPIGTFLSGGLDSSIITAVCAEELGKEGVRLPTFCVDYENNQRYFQPGKFQPDADSGYIRLMAERFATEHLETVLTAQDLSDALEDATVARDLPGMADVDFSLLAFCRQIRSRVKVALSGECADEIFGGYPWYRDPEVRSREGFPWAQNTLQRGSLLTEGLRERIAPMEYVMDTYREITADSDILPGTDPLERRMKEMVNLNFRCFMQTLLDRKDRMSMYSALEVRVPFCDWRIAEYLYGVPWEMKDYRGREQGLLRKAMEGLLPDQILYRKKSPYPKTFDPEYERIMEQRLQGILSDPGAPIHGLVDSKALQELLAGEQKWPWYGQLMGRPQTIAYFVQMDFWLRHYGVELMF